MSIQAQLISDEQRQTIQTFVRDMTDEAATLPTTRYGEPIDDHCSGEHIEIELFRGVTLIMDWAYLDAPSTYLGIDTEQLESYNRDSDVFLCEVGPIFDQIDSELCEIFDTYTEIEYDKSNSTESFDIWHIWGVESY